MRKFFCIFALSILLCLFILSLSVYFLPKSVIISNIKNQVLTATGRNIEIFDVNLMFWPDIGIELKDVRFANHAESKFKDLLFVDNLKLAVDISSLFKKKVLFNTIELTNPQINIELISEAKNSFTFDNVNREKREQIAEQENSQSESLIFEFGDINIVDASISIRDKDKSYNFDNLTFKIHFPDLDSVITLDGSFKYNKEKISAYISLDEPFNFLAEKSTRGVVRLNHNNSKISLKGVFAQDLKNIALDADIDIQSVPDFFRLVNKAEIVKNINISKAKLLGYITAEEGSITITKADIGIDEVKLNGSLDIDIEPHLSVFARLNSNRINIDRLLKKFAKAAEVREEVKDTKQASSKIDVSFLKDFDADIVLESEGFIWDNMDLGKIAITALLKAGELKLSIENAVIYKGNTSFMLDVNANQKFPLFNLEASVKDVDAKGFLNKFASFDKISGKLDASITVKSSGDDMTALIANSKGMGSASFKNGQFKDIDLLKIARLTQSRANAVNIEDGETKFSSLKGTFSIDKGILTNNDLEMKSPILSAKAIGIVNIPDKRVRYYITPTILSQSGVREGISIPLTMRGTFDNIKVEPDYNAVLKEFATDPQAAIEKVETVKEEIKETVETIKQNIKEDIKEDPVKALQGIFGSFFKQQPPTGDFKDNR